MSITATAAPITTVCKCGTLLSTATCPVCGRAAIEGRPFTPGGIDAVLIGR